MPSVGMLGFLPVGANGLSPIAQALAQFGFHAPLTEDVFLDSGYGAARFTRATTATVVDHEGAIRNCLSGEVRFAGQRRVRNMLATTSEDITNVAWIKSGCTVAGGAADPDGGTSATTITNTGGVNGLVYQSVASGSAAFRASVWLRRRTGTGAVYLRTPNNGNVNITSILTSSWQRFSTAVTAGTGGSAYFVVQTDTVSDQVDMWHPQLEDVTGQSNQNPSEYVSVGAAKANELRYTEEFDNGAWAKERVTVTANQASSPFGGAIAELVVETAAVGSHDLYTSTLSTIASGVGMVASVYAKKGPGATAPDWVQVCFSGSLGGTAYANYNLATGVVGTSSGCTASIVDAGGGWYRLVATLSTTSSGVATFIVALTNNNDGLGRGPSYLGVVTSDVYIYGAQLEVGTSPGTYFPVGPVYQYHGACVDGVKYFATENGNTVASNVVTEATGAAITRPENDGLTNGLVLPGVAGNSATTPDAAHLDLTGDLDIICRCAMTDWTLPTQSLIDKEPGGANAGGYQLLTSTGGVLTLGWTDDGGTNRSATSTAATGFSAGSANWVRATLDRDNGSGAYEVKFYTSPDGASPTWTQLGSTVSPGGTTTVKANASHLCVGASPGPVSEVKGIFYRAIVKDGIDGTAVFDADFTAQELGTTTFTESSSNAATVTINTSGTVPAYIGNPLRIFNYEGYLAESARTNLVLQSSNFGTTWAATGTPTRSAAAAYCGEIALDLIGDDDAGALEYYSQTVTFTGNATKSISFLVKQGTSTGSLVQLRDSTAGQNRLVVVIAWSGGVPVCTYTTGSAERASEYMGGGVWRIFCLTTSVTAASTNLIDVCPATTAAYAVANTGTIYIGGVQAENATTASASHIPTTTATVTTNKDELDFPAAGNATTVANSLYAECFLPGWPGGNPSLATVRNATERSAQLFWFSATAVNGYAFAGTYDDATSAGSPTLRTLVKAATAVAANDGMKAVNGTLGTADATVTVSGSAVVAIDIGKYSTGSQLNGVVRNVRVAATRVSNADLQLITQ